MRKKAAVFAVLAAFAAPAFIHAGAAVGGHYDKQFYAAEVEDEINVNDAENVLGEPDGRCAEIKPGGEMTVVMDYELIYLDGSDDGRIVTRGEAEFGLAGLFEGGEGEAPGWQALAPGQGQGGFKLGAMRSNPLQRTRVIRIVNNDDKRSVFIDAVVGFGPGK